MLNTAAEILAGWRRNTAARMLNASNVQSIIAVETSRLGDVIATLPVLSALRHRLPAASIAIIARSEYLPLLQAYPAVNAVIGYSGDPTVGEFLRVRRSAQELKPDLMLSMSPSHTNAIITLGSAPGAKAGYFRSYHPTAPFLHDSRVQAIGIRNFRPSNAKMQNIYRRAALVAESLGFNVAGHQVWNFPPSSAHQEYAGRERQPVVVHPFARWSFREWPLAQFVEVAELIVRECDTRVIFAVTSTPARDTDRLRDAIGTRPGIDIVHADTPHALAVLLSGASLFIGNDSGPLHLASALGIRTLGLYGPASPDLTAPQSAIHESLYMPLECSPCAQQVCSRPSSGCMRAIDTQQVAGRAIAILTRSDVTVSA